MSTVYLDGAFLPRDKAVVSVMDRGFLFGDGVYEVIPVYSRKPFRLDEHLRRLHDSFKRLVDKPVFRQFIGPEATAATPALA